MQSKISPLTLAFAAVLLAGSVCLASDANDAHVLPKGVFKSSLDGRFYWPVDKKYDSHGQRVDAAADYNGRVLDSAALPSLTLVEKAFGMPSGSANIGTSAVSFKYDFTDLFISLFYGATDRLTVGFILPYYWQKNTVKAALDPLRATVGKNADLKALAPLSLPGTIRLTTRDVLALLGPGLDIDRDGAVDIPGYRYKPFRTWSERGAGDLEIGGRYQYFKTKQWRLAFTGGVRLPTGEMDDPDSLVDLDFGSGAYALLFRFNHDYAGVRNLVLNGTLEYDLILPQRTVLRIPDHVDLPLTSNREKVTRDIGDIIGLKMSAEYTLLKGLTVTVLYQFEAKMKDRVKGDMGFNYESVEKRTDTRSHAYVVGFSYSTVPLFTEKKFPVPLCFDLSYRDRFVGKNNVLETKYIHLGLQIFF